MFINEEVKKNRDNLITRHFAGLLNEKEILVTDLQVTKNINSFDLIYTLEHWDKFLSEILSKFGLPSNCILDFNNTNINFLIQLRRRYKPNQKFYYYDFIIYSKISELKTNLQLIKMMAIIKKYV